MPAMPATLTGVLSDAIRNLKTTSASVFNHHSPENHMRDQSNAIRDQVSFKQRELHIRHSWDALCTHYNLNKSDLVKFLIKKEEYFLSDPETIPSRFMKDWL